MNPHNRQLIVKANNPKSWRLLTAYRQATDQDCAVKCTQTEGALTSDCVFEFCLAAEWFGVSANEVIALSYGEPALEVYAVFPNELGREVLGVELLASHPATPLDVYKLACRVGQSGLGIQTYCDYEI